MYRLLYRNKETGDTEMLWRYFGEGRYRLFKDVSLENEVDSSIYELIQEPLGEGPFHSFQLFGIECGKGWFPLLKPVIDYIDKYNDGKGEEEAIRIDQIKEKYGTLRVYVSHYTPELGKLIEEAEDESEKVCEICGSRKNVGSTLGWYITLCHDCIKERVKARGSSERWHSYEDGNIYWIYPESEDEYIETYKEYEERMQ